jgi:hypothetical protein
METITLTYHNKNVSGNDKQVSISFQIESNELSRSDSKLNSFLDEFLNFVKSTGVIIQNNKKLRLIEQRELTYNFENNLPGINFSDFNGVSNLELKTAQENAKAYDKKYDELIFPEDC